MADPELESLFQSTLPGWGATAEFDLLDAIEAFQSTLPGWGATSSSTCISTRGNFNPRSPDGERPSKTSDTPSRTRFQSTLPGWGATVQRVAECLRIVISIHAPRMGSDFGPSPETITRK